MIIISDFSKTFTRADMPTTWSVFAKSGFLGEAYTADRDTLYRENFPFEQAGDIVKTEEWFIEHAKLFAKYELTQDLITKITLDDTYFAPRDGVREFLDEVKRRGIKLVIVTSGILNLVETWFLERFNYIPDAIIGNELVMEDGRVVGVVEESTICPLDKGVEIEDISNHEEIIILGDSIEDLIVEDPKISLGFTDENCGFSVNLGRDASMQTVISYF